MAKTNGMNGSETLREAQWTQPTKYDLELKIELLLNQFSQDKWGEILSQTRIPGLLNQIQELAWETGTQLAMLHAETLVINRLTTTKQRVEILELHQRDRIANILGTSNDGVFSEAA